MKENHIPNTYGRRSFLKGLALTGVALTPASALLSSKVLADAGDRSGSLTKGDAAILRFLCAAEIIESDLWEQYWELGGVPSNEFAPSPSPFGNVPYTAALTILDSDMPQYITDNTDDEFTHAAFLREYLHSKGASTSEIDLLKGTHFRTLPGSTADGSTKKGRLTNLLNLNVDTSFWTRYRDDAHNPDLDTNFVFPQAQNRPGGIKNRKAIPQDNMDTAGSNGTTQTDHLKAIAFTAGFHFAFIEQGGTSVYPSLAQRVTNSEVLRILLSIGPTETMHFQTWQDKAGNATPLTDTDSRTGSTVTFTALNESTDPLFQANLIMPEPCPFLNRSLPKCSIIRPTHTKGAAIAAANAFINDNLFDGQTTEFLQLLADLAADADRAKREFDHEDDQGD
jgi:ferritin-like protein